MCVLVTLCLGCAQVRPGDADGFLAVNGNVVRLSRAYAQLAQDPYVSTGARPGAASGSRDQIVVILCDRPLSEAVIAESGLLRATRQARVLHLVRLELLRRPMMPADDRVGDWVVGRRALAHAALGDHKFLWASPDRDTHFSDAAVSPESITASISTKGPKTSYTDEKYEYEVRFSAPVRPRPLASAPVDASNGTALPPEGGAPGQAYRAYHEAWRTGDVAAILRLRSPDEVASEKEVKALVELTAASMMTEVSVVGGYVRATRATVRAEGTRPGGPRGEGTVELSEEDGVWHVLGENWPTPRSMLR